MMNQIQQISTTELIDMLNGHFVLVDVRPVDAYNGWRLREEARGGHIRSDRSLPAKWTAYLDWIEMVRHKGILSDNQLSTIIFRLLLFTRTIEIVRPI